MPISCNCSQCGREYNVKDDAAGRKFTCKDCSAIVEVPGGAAPPRPPRPSRPPQDGFGSDDDFGDDDEDFGGPPRRRRSTSGGSSRRRSRSSGGNGDGLAKASMWIGIVSAGLSLLWIIATAVLIGSIANMGPGARPGDGMAAGAGIFGLLTCGLMCLVPIACLTGTVMGVIAINQPLTSKTPAVVGLVLNAGILLLGGGFFLVSILVS